MNEIRNIVDISVARTMVTVYLSPLHSFRADAVDRLSMELQEVALSVQHAEAIVKEFTQDCPTPQELRDTAFTLRDKFQPQPKLSQEQEWEAEGYTREGVSDLTYYQQLMRRPRRPGEPNEDELMWRAIKKKLAVTNFAHVPIGECWNAAAELGFPLNSFQEQARAAWLQSGELPTKEIIQ